MQFAGVPRFAAFLLTASLLAGATPTPATAQPPSEPSPVRHDVARPGTEFLVLRHQRLQPGTHERFYEFSRAGVWPLYEKIGTRVVGQWQVVDPIRSPDWDGAYRLARYRSYEHWAATRRPWQLAGNGGDTRAGLDAIAARNELLIGSDGPIFLEGETREMGPSYHPALSEDYRPAASPGTVHPTRHGEAVAGGRGAGGETVTLRYFKIAKGSFDDFHRLSREGVWPFFEKMGARVVGQWKVVYPEIPDNAGQASAHAENPDWDEAYMMVRYASRDHWQATRPEVMHLHGGDGPDYQLCREALAARRELTVESSVEFLEGHFYASPPIFTPAIDEFWQPAP